MKNKTLIFLFIFFCNSLFGQDNQKLEDTELKEVNRVVLVFESALKKSDASMLKEDLSSKFSCMGYSAPIAEANVLPQILNQMPKGKIRIVNSSKTKEGNYSLDIEITPMQVPLIMDLDSNFKILNLNQGTSTAAPVKTQSVLKNKPERISLPFHLIDGFILLDAEIEGKRGKLMFDTGNPNSFLLNNNFLELNKDKKIGSGSVGSGQRLEVYQDEVNNIRLGLDFQIDFQTVKHANLGFTQLGITSDLMGFVGYEFMKDYEFVIDYDNQIIEMYLILDNKENQLYSEDEVVVELDFSTPFLSNIPYVDFDCNGQRITASFDTGNQGNLHLNESKTKEFVKSGVINEGKSNGIYGQSAKVTIYTMDNLSYNGVKLDKIKNMMISENSGIPITETNQFDLGIGYQFLKNYRSIWNFRTKKIILLSR
jgi:hypothetical protein